MEKRDVLSRGFHPILSSLTHTHTRCISGLIIRVIFSVGHTGPQLQPSDPSGEDDAKMKSFFYLACCQSQKMAHAAQHFWAEAKHLGKK